MENIALKPLRKTRPLCISLKKNPRMTRLTKKYTILVVASIVFVRLLTATIMTIWPDLLTTKISETLTHKISNGYLERGIAYLVNIVFVFLLYKEMEKEKVQSIPILVLTFFSSLIGVIFFLLTIAYDKFTNKQINQYE